MVTIEREVVNKPEAPSQGLIVAKTIIDCVNNVIAEELPLLAKNDILMNPNKLVPSSPDELATLEELIAPVVPIGLYRSLIASGVPEDALRRYRRSSISSLNSDPTDQNSVLISDRTLEQLSEDRSRNNVAGAMALDVLHLTIYNHPALRELDQESIWREIVRTSIHSDSFSARAKKVSLNTIASSQVEESRRILEQSLDNPQARFETKGAAVFLFLPGQKYPDFEYKMGPGFNEGVVFQIAENLHERILDILQKDGLIDKDTKRRYLVAIRQNKALKLAKEVCGMIGLRQENLLEAYLNSDIPRHYVGSDNKKLNPFDYPE